jgi:hypothetical protein
VGLINVVFIRSGYISFGLNVALALSYSIYILVDTQHILGDKKRRINLDDYILGATIIYMDIINLFMKLLKALGKKKKK